MRLMRYIGIPVAALAGLIGGYLIGQTQVSPGDLTFMDQVGKALANGIVQLTRILIVIAPIVLAVGGLLSIRAVRLWLTRAYEAVSVGLIAVGKLRAAFDNGVALTQIPMSVSVLAGLAIVGCSLFAAYVVAALIGLIGTLA